MSIKLNLFSAPLVILLLEAVPLAVVEESPDRYRLSFGASAGDYEYKSFDCSGALTGVTPVEYNTMGGRVDVLSGETRVSVFGGRVVSDADEKRVMDYDGAFVGAQFAGEWDKLGLGLGVVRFSGGDGFFAPSLYIRGGRLERLHFRFDLFPPSEMPGNTGWIRAGLGFKHGFAGMSIAPYTYLDQFEPRVFGEFQVPLHPRLELLIGGQVGPGQIRTQWGLGSGLRVSLGPEPR